MTDIWLQMENYFEKKERIQQEQEKYYREKTNRQLKYAAIISIGISIILMLIMACGFVNSNNKAALLIMRGWTGVFALFFVVLVGIIVYRVNTSYFENKAKSKHN